MPPPSRSLPSARLSRRAVLAAMAAVATGTLTGCTSEPQERRRDAEPAPVEPSVDPDVKTAAEALAGQQAILELLAATRERHRRLSGLLAPAVAAHEAHVAMLSDAVPDKASASSAPSSSLSSSPSETPSSGPSAGNGTRRTRVPRDLAQALDDVVAAEQALTTATKVHAFRAQSGAFARLLGSMAAASAQFAAALRAAPVNGKGAS